MSVKLLTGLLIVLFLFSCGGSGGGSDENGEQLYSCEDSYEPNDSFAEATYVASSKDNKEGREMESYICSTSDVDYFRAVVNSSIGMLSVSLAVIDGKDYDIFLYDSSYDEIDRSATRPQSDGISEQYILEEHITYMPYSSVPQGTYYIEVVGYEGAYANDHPYLLNVSFPF
jgi:bacillolysin/thermolysin